MLRNFQRQGGMSQVDPARCFKARLGGALAGIIAGLPVGLEIGGRVTGLFGKAGITWGAAIGAAVLGVIGGIGGNWLAWGSSSACDIDMNGPPPSGPGIPNRVAPKKQVTVIWIIIASSSTVMLVWPAPVRSFLSDVLVAVVWIIGIIWQYRTALGIRKNRQLRLARI